MRVLTALVVAGLMVSAADAAAQTEESRFFLSVNGALGAPTVLQINGVLLVAVAIYFFLRDGVRDI